MSKAKPTTMEDCKMNEWVFKDPQKNSRNGLTLFIDSSSTNMSCPKVQLPKCRTPFGVQEKKPDASEFSRRNLELSADDLKLQEWVGKFDELNIAKAHENSEKWFRKSLSKEALSELYRQCLQKSSKDPDKFAPLVRLKVSESGKSPTNVFVVYKDPESGEEKYKRGTVDDINRNAHIVPICEVSGLWFVSKGFGATLVATDILCWPAEEQEDFAFAGFDMQRGEETNDTAAPPAKRQREETASESATGGSLFGAANIE